jgi:phosphoribosylaminoimidazolecarboxamide formyltransferase / IMP cyclohydrolase
MSWPKAALLSLADKTGAAPFAAALAARGTRVLASGGTAAHLKQEGVPVETVESLTGFTELLGGRVKTLHPHVHAPILARRDVDADMAALAERDLPPIDLVAVTLYPFERRAPVLDEAGAVEEIDIGGVALLRAAAKNFAHVIVVEDPDQYGETLRALESGGPSLEQRRAWAIRTFARTARYDAAIAADLAARAASGRGDEAMREAERTRGGEAPSSASASPPPLPSMHLIALERVRTLRYGENPHQGAGLYARLGEGVGLEAWKEGKELSFNNLLDLDAAVALVWRFDAPACVIVKHAQPCGAACAEDVAAAYQAAFRSDELSAFGGVVAFNRALDQETATRLAGQFVECVAAPSFEEEARRVLASRKNLRAVTLSAADVRKKDGMDLRLAGRGALVQREEGGDAPPWRVVTRRAPTDDESRASRFAWEVAAAARSNAVAIARGESLVGIGSGQTSRVDAVDVAIMKARRSGHALERASLASDGFFPFADNIEHAAAAGITAIAQPGGSMRDAEVIEACDRLGMAMVFTDRRTFRH